jgi:hypothetical protein
MYVSHFNNHFLIFHFVDLIRRQLDNRLAVLTASTQSNPVSQITAGNLTAGIAPDAAQSLYGYSSGLTNQKVEYSPGYANQSYDPIVQLNQNAPSFAQSDSSGTSVVHDHGIINIYFFLLLFTSLT